MATRREQEQRDVATFMPANTRLAVIDGRNVWIFRKQTQVGIVFEIGLYYDPDEDPQGYCASVVSPQIEKAWRTPHIGHIFADGVLCYGAPSMRTRKTLREAFARSCLWAEGMAIMIASRKNGTPCEFPFSSNNTSDEARQ